MAGIYAHIPFCHSKCAYCDFYSITQHSYMDAYADAIVKEWKMRKCEASDYRTIYLGGGTPSILSDTSIGQILDAFIPDISISAHDAEITIEANPEDITHARVSTWRSMGINRISMGVQSFDDSLLKVIRRRHSAANSLRAIDNIMHGGIVNYSIDVIYGLPGQTLESWEETLNRLFDIKPPHFSAYLLSYEPRTLLTSMLKSGKIKATDETLILDMYAMICQKAIDNGYLHYEISNFALPSCQAKHNSAYWTGEPYIGLGAAAHSYDGNVRRINPSDTKTYIDSISQERTAYEIDEETELSQTNDIIMTSLRTSRGLDLNRLSEKQANVLLKEAQKHIAANNLTAADNRLWIPEDKWLISDSIISDLFFV